MKIINEKGKLFGIINPIDLIVVLAIIAVIAAFAVKTLKEPVQAVVTKNPDMYVTLRVRGALPSLVTACENIEKGERLVAGNGFVNAATVQEVRIEPYLYTAENAEGVSVACNDPLKKDILIVIKSSASPDAPVIKMGNQEVRTGRGFIFKTNLVEVNSTIESVEFDG